MCNLALKSGFRTFNSVIKPEYIAIARMMSGYFTKKGYYIVVSGSYVILENGYFDVYDPNTQNEFYIFDSMLRNEIDRKRFIYTNVKIFKNLF